MEFLIIGIILWLSIGFYGTFILIRSSLDIGLEELLMCVIGSVSGPIILIAGLIDKYCGPDKVFFKQYEHKKK